MPKAWQQCVHEFDKTISLYDLLFVNVDTKYFFHPTYKFSLPFKSMNQTADKQNIEWIINKFFKIDIVIHSGQCN